MRQQTNREIKGIFVAVCVLFAAFLLIPMIFITGKSFIGNGGWTFEYYRSVFGGREFAEIFVRSVGIAMVSALVTTILAFILAYSIHFTNIHPILKKGYTDWRLCRCCSRPSLMDLQSYILLENRDLSQNFLEDSCSIYMA